MSHWRSSQSLPNLSKLPNKTPLRLDAPGDNKRSRSGSNTEYFNRLPPELIDRMRDQYLLDDDDECSTDSRLLQFVPQLNGDYIDIARRAGIAGPQHIDLYNSPIYNDGKQNHFDPVAAGPSQWRTYFNYWCAKRKVTNNHILFNNMSYAIIASVWDTVHLDENDIINPAYGFRPFWLLRELKHGPIQTWILDPDVRKVTYWVRMNNGFKGKGANINVEADSGVRPNPYNSMLLDHIDCYFLGALTRWKNTKYIEHLKIHDVSMDQLVDLEPQPSRRAHVYKPTYLHGLPSVKNWQVFFSGFANPYFLKGLRVLALYYCRVDDDTMVALANVITPSTHGGRGALASVEKLIIVDRNEGYDDMYYDDDNWDEECVLFGVPGMQAFSNAILKGGLVSCKTIYISMHSIANEQATLTFVSALAQGALPNLVILRWMGNSEGMTVAIQDSLVEAIPSMTTLKFLEVHDSDVRVLEVMQQNGVVKAGYRTAMNDFE